MKRPPYARLLAERRNSNTWWVLIGADAWQTARTWVQPTNGHRPFCLLPPGADPCAFNWSQYRNAPPPIGLVRCGSIDGDQLNRLVQAMLAAGSPRIYDIFCDAVYVQELAA